MEDVSNLDIKAVIDSLRAYLEQSSAERDEEAGSRGAEAELVQQAWDQISAKGRVLVVDDERINQKLLTEVLSEENELLLADDGEEAIRLAHKTPQPDLILLDIVMPGIDGYEVCRRLKQDPETETIPVVFISGNISNEDERRGRMKLLREIMEKYNIRAWGEEQARMFDLAEKTLAEV